MSRFPPIPRVEWTESQEQTRRNTFLLLSQLPVEVKCENDEDSFYGPYAPLLYTDDMSEAWFSFAGAAREQKRFTIREKELCVLAVLSEHNVPWPLYAHIRVGKCVGFTEEQVQQAVHGELPYGLIHRESAIYELALDLTRMRGPLSDEAFEKAREVLRRDEIVGVAHIVSGYLSVAVLANLSAAGVPESEDDFCEGVRNPKLGVEDKCSLERAEAA